MKNSPYLYWDHWGSSSPVSLRNIRGDALVRTSYKEVKALNVSGKLEIDGDSSPVFADSIGGNIKIDNSYKYVIIKRSAGSIDVQGSSSPIEVSDILNLPPHSHIRLITTYKPVKLYVPDKADIKARVKTEYGKVRSDFPVYLSEDNTKIDTEGSTIVEIETSQDIILRKE